LPTCRHTAAARRRLYSPLLRAGGSCELHHAVGRRHWKWLNLLRHWLWLSHRRRRADVARGVVGHRVRGSLGREFLEYLVPVLGCDAGPRRRSISQVAGRSSWRRRGAGGCRHFRGIYLCSRRRRTRGCCLALSQKENGTIAVERSRLHLPPHTRQLGMRVDLDALYLALLDGGTSQPVK